MGFIRVEVKCNVQCGLIHSNCINNVENTLARHFLECLEFFYVTLIFKECTMHRHKGITEITAFLISTLYLT